MTGVNLSLTFDDFEKGLHRHFRMIAISEFMKSQGYAPPGAEHTRIPGIWKKLGTLYNLPGLEERVSIHTDTTIFWCGTLDNLTS